MMFPVDGRPVNSTFDGTSMDTARPENRTDTPVEPAAVSYAPDGSPSHAVSTATIGDSRQGIVGNVELLLKLAAAGVGLVAVMGFPAVYLQFSRFNIPAHFASYDQVLRAGILPAGLLVLAGFYLFWGVREFRKATPSHVFQVVPLILLSPLIVCVLAVLIISIISYVLIVTWALVWVVTWFVSRISGTMMTNRHVLYIAAGILVSLATSYILVPPFRPWLKSLRRFSLIRFEGKNQSTENGASTTKDLDSQEDGEETPWLIIVSLPFTLIIALYSVKALAYIWDPTLSPLLTHRFILILDTTCALILPTILMLRTCRKWMTSTDRTKKLKGYGTIGSLFTVALISSMVAYSNSLYPRIPRGLGGGRPEKLVIWIAKEDFPEDLQQRISKAKFISRGDTIRCENIYLIYDDSATLIIVDGNSAPASGAILPRDKVKAISW